MIKKLLIGLCIMLLLPIQAFAIEDNFKVNADGAILDRKSTRLNSSH